MSIDESPYATPHERESGKIFMRFAVVKPEPSSVREVASVTTKEKFWPKFGPKTYAMPTLVSYEAGVSVPPIPLHQQIQYAPMDENSVFGNVMLVLEPNGAAGGVRTETDVSALPQDSLLEIIFKRLVVLRPVPSSVNEDAV
jgi:hypothetical protein